MTQSDRLRTNPEQAKPKNIVSKNMDERLSEATARATVKLASVFPKETFVVVPRIANEAYLFESLPNIEIRTNTEDRLNVMDIQKLVKAKYPHLSHLFADIKTDRSRGYLLSDSGEVYLKKKTLLPLFVGEGKAQGTNEKRIAEGKPKQAMGQAALDRAQANVKYLMDHMHLLDISIFNFVLFFEGCDFQEESYIRDRLYKYTNGLKLNTLYIHSPIEEKPVSVFAHPEPFSVDELETIVSQVMKESLVYYLTQYAS